MRTAYVKLGPQTPLVKGFATLNEANREGQNGNFQRAIELAKLACNVLRKDPSSQGKDGLIKGLNNMGAWYASLGEFKPSQSYLEEALTIAKTRFETTDPRLTCIVYNLFRAYINLGEYQNAISVGKMALSEIEGSLEISTIIGLPRKPHKGHHEKICYEIGRAYFMLNQKSEAVQYFFQAFELSSRLNGAKDPFTELCFKWLEQSKAINGPSD